MRKRLILTGLLVFMLTLLAFPAVASAEGDTVRNMITMDWYPTIQAAVDNADPYDEIHVYPNDDGSSKTYTENVDVNVEGLSIIAMDEDVVGIHVEAASASDQVFEVTADWVTIQGFYIHGASGSTAGIYLDDVADCWIDSNHCYDNYYGIYLESSNNNNQLISNTAYSNTSHSIELHMSSNNYLEGNDCSNGYLGIFVNKNSNSNELLGNTCSDNSYIGIELYNSDNNIVDWSTCEGNTSYGISLQYSDDNRITNNQCNSNGYGIRLFESDDNTISGNTCSLNYHGVFFDGAGGNTLTYNNVLNSGKVGIHFTSSDTSGNVIHNSNILNNGVSGQYDVYNVSTHDVDATNNWWGTTDCSVIDAHIYDKKDGGDLGEVIYLPLLSGGAPVPEIATIVLLGLGLLGLGGVIWFKRRRIAAIA